MQLVTTQSNFQNHLNDYLDKVDNNETILVKSKQKTVAIISQEKLNVLLDAVNAKEDSLQYAITRDKLVDMKVLPDDSIIKPTNDYWENFKK